MTESQPRQRDEDAPVGRPDIVYEHHSQSGGHEPEQAGVG